VGLPPPSGGLTANRPKTSSHLASSGSGAPPRPQRLLGIFPSAPISSPGGGGGGSSNLSSPTNAGTVGGAGAGGVASGLRMKSANDTLRPTQSGGLMTRRDSAGRESGLQHLFPSASLGSGLGLGLGPGGSGGGGGTSSGMVRSPSSGMVSPQSNRGGGVGAWGPDYDAGGMKAGGKLQVSYTCLF
jgi:hypothetical protein